jgi:hypothetical protein
MVTMPQEASIPRYKSIPIEGSDAPGHMCQRTQQNNAQQRQRVAVQAQEEHNKNRY